MTRFLPYVGYVTIAMVGFNILCHLRRGAKDQRVERFPPAQIRLDWRSGFTSARTQRVTPTAV